MKNEILWLVAVIIAVTSSAPAFAASYVPPYEVPDFYDEHVVIDENDFLDPKLSFTWELLTYYWFADSAIQGIHYYKPISDGWPLDVWTTVDWVDSGWPLTQYGACWMESTWGGTNAPGRIDCGELSDAPLSFGNTRANYFLSTDVGQFGDPGLYTADFKIFTWLGYWTGGVAGVPRTNFLRLHVSATDNFTVSAIPATNLTVGAASYGRADSDGNIYLQGEDNKWYDGTVFADQTRYSNYTYALTPASAYLQIRRGTNNLAGQTNTVIVGEQVALTCLFVDPATDLSSSIAPITNFQWTVPGNTVSNYLWEVTPSVLNTDLNLTNHTTYFYWYRPATGLTVQCSIVAKGVTMTAKTTFNVLAPTYIWQACRSNHISMDADYFKEGTWLHFGNPFTSNGMTFRGDPISLVQSNFGMDVIQTFAFSEAKVWSNGVRLIAVSTNSLDFPEGATGATLDSNKVLRWSDSPGLRGFPTEQGIARADSFLSYLMYRSPAANSIPVPLSVLSWSWSGSATNNGSWSLTSSPFSFSPTNCLQGTSWPEFPMWKTLWPDDVLIWNAF